MSVLPSPSIQMARSMLSVNTDELNGMSAYELFQRQLESGSTEACVDAMKRLSVVSAVMGPTEAAEKLLPYLTKMVLQQPPPIDELLLMLGQQLIEVSRQIVVTGDVKYVTDFLPMLERLASIEETVVRDQAVVVFVHLTDLVVDDSKKNSTKVDPIPWLSVVKRLVSADWFTAKVSAAGIVASVFSLLMLPSTVGTSASQQQEMLALYRELCQDETPMVRRAAAKNLGHVLAVAGWPHRDFGAAQVPLLCRDEQDSVRLLAVASLGDVGPSFGENPQWTIQHWVPLIKEGATDLSWRVRNNLAKNFSSVAINTGLGADKKHGTTYSTEQTLIMACFVSVLTDIEAEVRAAAVGHLARMVAWGGPALFQSHLQPLLAALADDVVMEVRSKCALALMDTAHDGSLEDSVVTQSFGPLLESFLQDEFHEVQLQVLTNLHKIANLLPGLPGVVSALLQMSKATNWRVRQAVAQLLPHLAEARGLDFFNTVLLEPAWLTLLLDPVASVRLAIVRGMPLLVKVAGDEWIDQNLFPHHLKIYNQNSETYLVRLTILHAHLEAANAPACNKNGEFFKDSLVPQILRGLNDKVCNVRTVAAQGLAKIVSEGDPGVVQGLIKPALEQRLKEESDEDCRRAVQAALNNIK